MQPHPLASHIEHTLLAPDATLSQMEALCDEAVAHHFAGVCVPPYFVLPVARRLSGHPRMEVATVVGFPMGYSTTPSKVEEVKRAINSGATAVDVVMNIAAFLSNDPTTVFSDLEGVCMAAHYQGCVVKVILETALLPAHRLPEVCQLVERLGAEYAKTSTGYNGGAEVGVVARMRELLPPRIKIKASGGIRTLAQAEALLAAGATRLGTSAGVALVREGKVL